MKTLSKDQKVQITKIRKQRISLHHDWKEGKLSNDEYFQELSKTNDQESLVKGEEPKPREFLVAKESLLDWALGKTFTPSK